MKQKQIRYLVEGALIAAVYAAATYLCALWNLAYGPIQFRFSEALSVLAVFTPAAVPGLTIGCVLGNLTSPMGIWDILFGSLATLLAALTGRWLRRARVKGLPLLSMLMPVIFNALIVGLEIAILMPTPGRSTWLSFLIAATEVGCGELVVCYAGGIPLFLALRRTNLFPEERNLKAE